MATNKVQCPYGHFYNPDKYVDCPICNKSLLSSFNAQTSVTPQRETTASRSQFEETPAPSPAPVRNSGTYRPTSSVFGNQYEDTSMQTADSFKTVSIMNDTIQAAPDAPSIVIPESIPKLATRAIAGTNSCCFAYTSRFFNTAGCGERRCIPQGYGRCQDRCHVERTCWYRPGCWLAGVCEG